MSVSARSQSRVWDYFTLELLAVAVALVLAWLAPLRGISVWQNAALLEIAGGTDPLRSVAVVEVAPDEARAGECQHRLRAALGAGMARAGLVIPPLGDLCGLEATGDDQAAVALLPLLPSAIRLHLSGRILGFRPSETLRQLGIPAAQWTAPRDWRAVPRLRLEQLLSGQVEAEVLRDRIVLLVLREAADGAGPYSSRVAAAIGSALEDRPRREPPQWLALLATALAATALVFASRRGRLPWSLKILAPLVAIASLAGVFGFGYLIATPTLVLALGSSVAVVQMPRWLAKRRADADAERLFERAQALRAEAAHEISDSEFWQRLANRVTQAHPADDVLVAELPAYSWRLRIWPNGDLTEAIIRERRRDIRRVPYANEQGVPVTSVSRSYLVMQDVPTVLVPLIAEGEVEGYLFLIGTTAEQAFLKRGHLTQRVGDELAALIRRRRLTKLRNDDWRRPGGLLVQDPGQRSEALLTGARAMLEEIHLFNALVENAPVGLVYADSFGDVRIIGTAFLDWLPALGVSPPPQSGKGVLPPGALPLRRVLEAFAEQAGDAPPLLSDIGAEDLILKVPAPTVDGHQGRVLRLAVRRLGRSGQSSGFVASLFELASDGPDANVQVARLPERGDPLAVVSLAELVSDVVDSAARRTEGRVKLQTPRAVAHAIVHRRDLARTLEEFLVEVARAEGAEGGPVLTLTERRGHIELTILDLRLGVPAAAVRRAVIAPSDPPPGLQTLGDLVRSVENCHGTVALKSDAGWHSKLHISLLRAHPRVVREPTSPAIDLRSRLPR